MPFTRTLLIKAQYKLWLRNLKTQHTPVILDLCLRKTRTEKSRDYLGVVVFQKLRLQNVFNTKTKGQCFQIPLI